MSRPIPEDARRRLAARARQIARIRRRVLAATLATFVLAWGVIAATGSMGATPATTQTASTSASGSGTASSGAASTSACGSGTASSGAATSSPTDSSASSSSSGRSSDPVTTSQS